eukprot:SAG11_NODE_15710_length_568_cov_3.782516_1_plen_103_part_00
MEHATEGLVAIGAMLGLNSTLQTIDMRMNMIGDAGGKILADALGRNQTIKNIHITGRMSGSMFKAVREGLSKNSGKKGKKGKGKGKGKKGKGKGKKKKKKKK